MEKLKVESLVSAEVRVSNADSESRLYDISAVVRVEESKATNVSQGYVYNKNNESQSEPAANFDSWTESSLNVQFHRELGRAELLSEIESFINKCRTDQNVVAGAISE